ncbi:hypothetical protein ACIB24_04480 [Spongisporangium articulatum]|uniref:Solute:sodium symporter small subunit n=1 Tax=Spongisporangium articulatum TaxID=3362603 RepID=A0ABW8AIW7_9ACTN
MTEPKPPPRVRVTSPQMAGRRRAHPAPGRGAAAEIDEQTGVGELYLTGLLRSQLRAGLALLALVLLGLGGLPVLFLLLPQVADHPIGPVTVAWLLLGAAVYPVLLLAAWWHVRTAERVERDFVAFLRRR